MVLRLPSLKCLPFIIMLLHQVTGQADFTHEQLLDAGNDYWLRWSYTGDSIDIEASARTLGWLAFGFSWDGGMDKSDVMFGYVNSTSGRANVSDRFLVADGANVQLILDTQQDWELLTASRNQTHTSVRVRRKLDTCDSQDHPITKDTMRVIFSMDQQQPTDFLHPTMHDFRGGKSILFLDDSLAVRKLGVPIVTHATLEWNVLMDGVTIPESVTSRFHCKLLKIPPFNRKFHVVKVEPKIEAENVDLVRNIVVSVCSPDITDAIQPQEFVCGIEHPGDHSNPQETSLLRNCTTLLAAWSVGASSFVYPDDVGYPIGPELSGRYVLLQTQYVNDPLQRRVDSSGVNFALTDKLRKYEAGILAFGLSGNAIVPPAVSSSFTFYGHCSDGCTKQALPEDGVTVFGGSVHTNPLGRVVRLRQIRDSVELPPLLQDGHFDSNYQATRGIYPNRKILRGDKLTLECTYGTPSRTSSAPVTDELCSGMVFFYPRINMTSCQSKYQPDIVGKALGWGTAETEAKSLGGFSLNGTANETTLPLITPTNTTIPVEIPANIASQNWTPEKVLALQNVLHDGDVLAQCQFENGYDYEEVEQLKPFVPTQKPNSTCAVVDGGGGAPDAFLTPAHDHQNHQMKSLTTTRSSGVSVNALSSSLLSVLGLFFFTYISYLY